MATTVKKNPVAAEATGSLIAFDYEGVSYEISPASEWTIEALEAFEDDRIVAFLREILGAEQFQTFKRQNPRVSDIPDFVTVLQGALGISGN